jgi:hypothetical protein
MMRVFTISAQIIARNRTDIIRWGVGAIMVREHIYNMHMN